MILLYGATGYTAGLILEEARRAGVSLVLAGRDRARVEALAKGEEVRAFDLHHIDLSHVKAVLHCAGPFSRTCRPMVDACLAAGVHYLDITGEISVFEAMARRDAKAREAGIVLLPGVGMDVVPSDCLAAWVAAQRPDATSLHLGVAPIGQSSHGTATTMIEGIHLPPVHRRGGKIVPVPGGFHVEQVDFGERRLGCLTASWGDVSTAFHSTGIPDIDVVMSFPPRVLRSVRYGQVLRPLLAWAPVRRWLQSRIDAGPAGPSPEARARGYSLFQAEARGPSGSTVAYLRTPEGYTLTARTALDAALRVARGEVRPGFHTPSRAFGADYILGFEGCVRTPA